MSKEILTLEAPEIRLADGGETGVFEGYGAIFNEIVRTYNERVMPGAFRKTLAEYRAKKRLPPMFWNHDSSEPIGLWTSMTEDERGLKVSGKLITTTRRGQEVLEFMKAGMPLGLSIGFRPVSDRRAKDGVRELSEVELLELSATPNPAADNARITKFRNAAAPADIAAFLQAVRRAAASMK